MVTSIDILPIKKGCLLGKKNKTVGCSGWKVCPKTMLTDIQRRIRLKRVVCKGKSEGTIDKIAQLRACVDDSSSSCHEGEAKLRSVHESEGGKLQPTDGGRPVYAGRLLQILETRNIHKNHAEKHEPICFNIRKLPPKGHKQEGSSAQIELPLEKQLGSGRSTSSG
eukprot:scaffold4468_cov129-Cylindrotheca_fusiformis.AAC.4